MQGRNIGYDQVVRAENHIVKYRYGGYSMEDIIKRLCRNRINILLIGGSEDEKNKLSFHPCFGDAVMCDPSDHES